MGGAMASGGQTCFPASFNSRLLNCCVELLIAHICDPRSCARHVDTGLAFGLFKRYKGLSIEWPRSPSLKGDGAGAE